MLNIYIKRFIHIPRIEKFLRWDSKLKFRANKIRRKQKKRKNNSDPIDSVECQQITPYVSHSASSFAFTRNKNPSPLHDFKISSAKHRNSSITTLKTMIYFSQTFHGNHDTTSKQPRNFTGNLIAPLRRTVASV